MRVIEKTIRVRRASTVAFDKCYYRMALGATVVVR